jgi:peptidoglycan/LPS O-acetylase OafA/YrhL
MQYRSDIDGLRGIAVLSVLAFHAFPNLAPGGFIGVDVFFVISGFLISTIIIEGAADRSLTLLDFYGRRIRRIFPALVVVLACCLVYGFFMLLPHDYAKLGENTAGGAGFISNFVLLRESGYFSAAPYERPLLHLWSLGIEEQYYILWPAVLMFACRLRWCAWILALAAAILSFVLNLDIVSRDSAAAFYLPQSRFWELLIGATFAAYVIQRRKREGALTSGSGLAGHAATSVAANARSVAGAMLLIGGFARIDATTRFPGWWALLPTCGTLMMISAGGKAWLNRHVLSNGLLVRLGLISYPLYLWHWPLIALPSLYFGEYAPRSVRISVVGVSIGLAILTYQGLEIPIRKRRQGSLIAVILVAAMALVGFAGWQVFHDNGYPRRFPPPIREVDAIEFDNGHERAWREGSCFLELDQTFESFAKCPRKAGPSKPILLLWGDSLAAQLYPGYEAVYGDQFEIVQRTASACAPLFDDAYNRHLSNCDAINRFVLDELATLRPERVVLSARWAVHDWPRLAATVEELRAAGVQSIDLIGGVPRWKISLPRQIISILEKEKVAQVPQRMTAGLESGFRNLEPNLRQFAERNQVRFLSPIDVLCNEEGCLTRTGESPSTLTSFDYDHLSPSASIFVISRFRNSR